MESLVNSFLNWIPLYAIRIERRQKTTTEESENPHHFQLKVAIIGPPGSGKSSLLSKIISNTFSQKKVATFMFDYTNYSMEIEKPYVDSAENPKVLLNISELNTTANWGAHWANSLRRAALVIITVDCQKENSLEDSIAIYDKFTDGGIWEHAAVVLVATKNDVPEDCVVSYTRVKEIAKQKGLLFFKSSAKNDSCDRLYRRLAKIVKKVIEMSQDGDTDKIWESFVSPPHISYQYIS